MCEPTTLAVAAFAFSAGSTLLNHRAQGQAAEANKEAAEEAYAVNSRDLGIRQQEEMKAAARQHLQGRRQAREAKSTLDVSAGEAGVSGFSVDALRGEIERDEGAFLHTVDENAVVTIEQLQRMKEGASATAQSRVNAVASPSLLNTGLQIGAAGLDLMSSLRLRRGTQ